MNLIPGRRRTSRKDKVSGRIELNVKGKFSRGEICTQAVAFCVDTEYEGERATRIKIRARDAEPEEDL